MGRPKKEFKQINPQVQFGRRCQADIDLIDRAAQKAGKTRSQWAWEILLKAAGSHATNQANKPTSDK